MESGCALGFGHTCLHRSHKRVLQGGHLECMQLNHAMYPVGFESAGLSDVIDAQLP
jgi:hypothetical protein